MPTWILNGSMWPIGSYWIFVSRVCFRSLNHQYIGMFKTHTWRCCIGYGIVRNRIRSKTYTFKSKLTTYKHSLVAISYRIHGIPLTPIGLDCKNNEYICSLSHWNGHTMRPFFHQTEKKEEKKNTKTNVFILAFILMCAATLNLCSRMYVCINFRWLYW